MQKLYKFIAFAYVLAEDEATALDILSDENILPTDNGMSVEVYEETTGVDTEWYDLLPFGSETATCGQIIKLLRQQRTA